MDSRGRITVPKAVRERLGLLPGSVLAWHVEGDRLVLANGTTARRSGRAVVERMRGAATVRTSTDEVLRLTRG